MDLKRIDASINAYREKLSKDEMARLDFFRGLWEIQERSASS